VTRRVFTSQLMTKPGLDYTENLYDDDGKKMRGWRFLKIRDYSPEHSDFNNYTSHAKHVSLLTEDFDQKKNENKVRQTIKEKSVSNVLEMSDEDSQALLEVIRGRIYYLGYSMGFTEFTPVQVLMEMKGYDLPVKPTIELIEQLIDDNIDVIKFCNKPIIRSGDKYITK